MADGCGQQLKHSGQPGERGDGDSSTRADQQADNQDGNQRAAESDKATQEAASECSDTGNNQLPGQRFRPGASPPNIRLPGLRLERRQPGTNQGACSLIAGSL
jgi:hypothetical protein